MTTPHLVKKQLILAKIETSYGVDPTPTGAANAILMQNLSVKPISPTIVKRNVLKGFLGAQPQMLADVHSEISFEVEIAGSGTAGTAPAYGPLLRACALSETISAGSSVTYAPVSSAFESVTIYYFADGVLHKMRGCLGTVQFDFTAKKVPVAKFTMTGLYNTPTDTANPTAVYTGFKIPKVVSNANTTGFNFNGYAGHMMSLTLDLKNSVQYRTLVGVEYVQITDHDCGGACEFEMPSIADANLYDQAISQTVSTLALQHGTTAGNICTISSSKLIIVEPTLKEDNDVLMLSFTYGLVPDAAGNDVSIIFT